MDRDALFIAGVRALPRRSLSRAARRVVDVRSAMAVRRFAAAYDIDLAEAEHPLEGYASVHDLFTRRLKPGARPVDPDPDVMVSPVDGALSAQGDVGAGDLPQAKGRTYGLAALLADDEAPARFARGSFATIYLSPRDYHRIHAPVDGEITGWTHVPGDLFPVNAAAVSHVDALFAKNERLVTHIRTERLGRVEVVKVGATIVGRVRASYAPEVTTNVGGVRAPRTGALEPPRSVGRGEEIGVFEMGSTVIVVAERPLDFIAAPDRTIRLGEALARSRA